MNPALLSMTNIPEPSFLSYVAFVSISYLLGSIPFGLVLTKLMGKGDIRQIGSGNIGATNVLRSGSKALAIATLLGDVLKGVLAVKLAQKMLHLPDLHMLLLACAFTAIMGHIYPVWLQFKGGKGVATYLGVLCTLNLPIGMACLLTWLLVAILSRYSSLSALISISIAPLYIALSLNKPSFIVFTLVCAVIICYKHQDNIKRLLNGTETKIGKDKNKKTKG